MFAETFKDFTDAADFLTQPNWMPSDTILVLSQNGSMQKDIIKLFIDHNYCKAPILHKPIHSLLLCFGRPNSKEETKRLKKRENATLKLCKSQQLHPISCNLAIV